ncbi:dienelactone hydrolase family protein [Hoeflea sp. YIM 152468]|uniref:dienelactone hydrolase family protein n=1 Tax=Hoeflea sp. YIM 152468 TaxID=3031759 RepID=UPI0023DB056A|nr:dienelactone hydrolase family protein [Hoeflea sp. YIM 152468]MDF1608474.1 dienelactone hydrolase family protein [Hoeflea sp. YIM 152468]
MADKPTVTQAMIQAYDDYTHLTLDRRGFMNRLTKLAGSGAAAAAIAPLLAANSARAAIVAADDRRIETHEVTFAGATGRLQGYLAMPADATAPVPGMLVIHENRGLNDHIRDIARRMALEGFAALAVDFLSPLGGTPDNEDTARTMFNELDASQTTANAAAARAWLAGYHRVTDKVGAIGFCWGGGLVNELAVADPELRTGIVFYGRQPDTKDVASIKAAMLLHYAGLDERINSGIKDYRNALLSHDKVFAIHVYPRVNHAFHNDTSAARYNKAAADLAWERTIAFLRGTMF